MPISTLNKLASGGIMLKTIEKLYIDIMLLIDSCFCFRFDRRGDSTTSEISVVSSIIFKSFLKSEKYMTVFKIH